MAREKTSDDVTFERRPEVSEGTSHVCIQRESVLGRESSKYKDPLTTHKPATQACVAGLCLVSGETL